MPERDPDHRGHDRPYDSVAPPPALPPGWRVVAARDAQVRAAETLEYRVFVQVGFCEPSVDERIEEFDPWREQSRFKVVLDPQDRLKGVVRELFGSYRDLPVGSFARDATYPPDPVLEYASLAVPDDVRNAGVAESLYRSVWQDALRVGAGGLVAIAADWLLTILNGTYDLGFRRLGPSRYYMGGDCIPVGTSMADLIARLRSQPSFFRWATEEIDLRDLPLEEFRSAVEAARAAVDGRGSP